MHEEGPGAETGVEGGPKRKGLGTEELSQLPPCWLLCGEGPGAGWSVFPTAGLQLFVP